jgi:hypothetical protein
MKTSRGWNAVGVLGVLGVVGMCSLLLGSRAHAQEVGSANLLDGMSTLMLEGAKTMYVLTPEVNAAGERRLGITVLADEVRGLDEGVRTYDISWTEGLIARVDPRTDLLELSATTESMGAAGAATLQQLATKSIGVIGGEYRQVSNVCKEDRIFWSSRNVTNPDYRYSCYQIKCEEVLCAPTGCIRCFSVVTTCVDVIDSGTCYFTDTFKQCFSMPQGNLISSFHNSDEIPRGCRR